MKYLRDYFESSNIFIQKTSVRYVVTKDFVKETKNSNHNVNSNSTLQSSEFIKCQAMLTWY